MNFRVCRVAELLQQQIFFRVAGDNLFCFLNRAFHALRAFGQYQIRAECFQQLTTFNTHGFRHSQRQLITARCRNVGESDTGVTAGRFNQLNACFQYTAFFGIPNHIGTNSAFYAKARVA